MSYANCQEYFLCIEPLKAEEMLNDFSVSAFPHIKNEKAKKLEKAVRSRAEQDLTGSRTQLTTKDIYEEMVRKFSGR